MSPTEKFLSRVESKHRPGAKSGVFKCTAHKDKRASATWRETDSGALLVHCFAGCSAAEIMAAAGLELQDLFPERQEHHGKPERRHFPAADVLRAVAFEALVVAAAASAVAAGEPLTSVDRDRLIVAAERLRSAATEAGL
jgi:hypothetical protein